MERAERPSLNATLAASVRLIRMHRRMRTAEVARAMGMAPRSYEHFEAGGGKVNLERIHRFAAATGSDPYAILAALAFGSPEFALRCADNKLMSILMVSLKELDEDAGDAIADLEALPIINAFTRATKDLAAHAVRRDAAAEAWLRERLEGLVAPDGGPDEAD